MNSLASLLLTALWLLAGWWPTPYGVDTFAAHIPLDGSNRSTCQPILQALNK